METILASVVESGTGRLANVQGLTVAGKTGTAQKVEPNGRYSHSRFVASFVGYGPVPDARLAIVVSMDEPRPVYFGGSVAAPMFRRVVEQMVSYWDLNRSLQTQVAGAVPPPVCSGSAGCVAEGLPGLPQRLHEAGPSAKASALRRIAPWMLSSRYRSSR